MAQRTIDLACIPNEVMLLVEHVSGVVYRNQVGGVTCWQAELEGVLAPIDVSRANVERIMGLPYPPRHGITAEIADALDEALAGQPGTRYLKVDRARLHESLEAWVFVVAATQDDTPDHLLGPDYFGAIFGFGRVSAVLTWPNSD
jgi:hypothetical protein